MTIVLTNQKAVGLIHELEELHLIRIINQSAGSAESKLSDKYRGVLTKEQGEDLNTHIERMRSEWNNI